METDPDKKGTRTRPDTFPGKILVVDDSASIRTSVRDLLAPRYAVKTADSGEAALAVLGDFRPDVVLLDVTMGGMDGYTVCRLIRSDKAHGFIKILMVSSRSELAERLTGYEAGADDYIPKPFKEEELLAKVTVFLRLKSVEDELQTLNDCLQEQVQLRTQQLLQAERLATIGRHAAGIVHNLNTPLQAVMGGAELLSVRHPDNETIMRLRKAAAHMKKIIGSILSSGSRTSETEYTVLDLSGIIQDQIDMLSADPFFKHRIEKRMDLPPLPPYRGVPAHFSQIFGNLIKNAADAMFACDRPVLTISGRADAATIWISITDTGHGIAGENLARIFHPFYTTKPLNPKDGRPGGTGLGLASAKEMVESYGGSIEVTSTVGEGGTFTVRLPRD